MTNDTEITFLRHHTGRKLTADEFRTAVRHRAACPTCGAPEGYYCRNEDTGGRRLANHAARVQAVTGQDLTKGMRWGAVAKKKAQARDARAARAAGR